MQKEDVKIGTRVRLRAPSPLLSLQSDTGTIVRPDEWADYYVIRLDRPALYRHVDGRTEELEEVCEDLENLETL